MATIALPEPSAAALTESQFVQQWEPMASSVALTEQREQIFVFSVRGGTYRIVIKSTNASVPDWVVPTIKAFAGILNLSDNWDSYGGRTINRDLIREALFILGMVMKADSPAPSVVPLGDSGLQIEWHRRQQDLEITFAFDEAPKFFYHNRATRELEEGFAHPETEKLINFLGSLV